MKNKTRKEDEKNKTNSVYAWIKFQVKLKLSTLIDYINSFDKLNLISILIVIIALATISQIAIEECSRCLKSQKQISKPQQQDYKTFIVHGKNIESGYLKHVFLVLDRLGYKHQQDSSNWDLLWAHDYPFRVLYDKLNKLKSHQKVNHFPGCGYLTNKVDLATSGLKYIPPAFKLPRDKEKLLEFSTNNPEKSFVVKNNDHRNVRVKNLSEIDLNSNDSFVQEFIDNPLLVSGYMFDIGIYTIITSIDPLRIYIYNGDALLRFCPEKYLPFDRENLNKYVVGDDYLPTWEVPGLDYFYNELGFGMRDSLNGYLKSQGKDPSVIWSQIEDAIRTVVIAKEPLILDIVKRFKSKRNFFEMMRFDFVVDENLKVSLMEANMSPNLSSAHFKPNQLLYEQVIFNLLGLVGIAERINKASLAIRSQEEELMQTSGKHIVVTAEECNSPACRDSCIPSKCQLCRPCLPLEMREEFLIAYKEHLNRGDCKRIFPHPMIKDGNLPAEFANFSGKNQLMYKWFHEKCLMDSTWCN